MSGVAEPLAWGWVAHLQAGGTTTWREWRASPTSASAEPDRRFLPGAQQLELLRRLNLARGTSPALAERVLRASAVGRGVPDLALVGARELSFGPPPVEPNDLPADELLRVAVGLLAEDLAGEQGPPLETRGAITRDSTGHNPGFNPRRRHRYRLVGDPWRADPVRRSLIEAGRPPGGPDATLYVLGTDLPTMLADAWTARSFAEGCPAWPDFLEGAATARRLPRRADLLYTARAWAERVGVQRVHVVLDAGALPRLLRVRGPVPDPPAYAAEAVDLARRTGEALSLFVPGERRQSVLHGVLGPLLAVAEGPPVRVPERHRDWVRVEGARIREGVLADGYAVHGSPDTLTAEPAGDAPGADEPDVSEVMALALRLLLGPKSGPR